MFVKEDLVPMKGKRSKRARADSPPLAASSTADDVVSSCNVSAEFRDEEDEDMANCLILLARGEKSSPPRGGGFYQCKTCSKSFPSFQALGGHRASHTKPVKEEKRAGWTERRELLLPSCGESTILSLQIPTGNLPGSKSRVHECSICGAEFASGQALGGHMRRHRPIPTCGGERGSSPEGKRARSSNVMSLDLNLPAPEDEDQMESKFPFAAKQVIVFSASSMVDCHY